MNPYINYDNLPDEYYSKPELSKKLQDDLVYHTKTIGPVAPPAEFKATDFIDYLIKLKHEAQDIGWIKKEGGQGIINALDKKLDNAKKAIERGSDTSARNVLEAFIQQVEAQGCESHADCKPGKHLSPEATALLKFNAEYLIDHL